MELVERLGSGIPRVLQVCGRECFEFSYNYKEEVKSYIKWYIVMFEFDK